MQQAITWANVDPNLCRHMVPLGHNESTETLELYSVDIICLYKHNVITKKVTIH